MGSTSFSKKKLWALHKAKLKTINLKRACWSLVGGRRSHRCFIRSFDVSKASTDKTKFVGSKNI